MWDGRFLQSELAVLDANDHWNSRGRELGRARRSQESSFKSEAKSLRLSQKLKTKMCEI